MVKFARDCMLAMNKVTADLSDSLGQDTKDLGFRVGLHSGPTTAGVLRGHKGRFQLFGDTGIHCSRSVSFFSCDFPKSSSSISYSLFFLVNAVNTASRMESNGVPGRIHVSESTADCLRAANKKQWLTPREDKITAKGKGEMQTYWVNPAKGLSPTMSVSTSSSC